MLKIMTSITLVFHLLFTSLLFLSHCAEMKRSSRKDPEIISLFMSSLPAVIVETFFPKKTLLLILLMMCPWGLFIQKILQANDCLFFTCPYLFVWGHLILIQEDPVVLSS